MKDHSGCRRAFIWSSKAWYADGFYREGEEVMFGMYAKDNGGTSGEMAMRWKDFSGHQVPQLQVFDDAWSALSLFTDVIEKLGEKDNENITPKQFIEILLSCGFVDDTAYESPYEPKETALRKEIAEAERKVKELKEKLGDTAL